VIRLRIAAAIFCSKDRFDDLAPPGQAPAKGAGVHLSRGWVFLLWLLVTAGLGLGLGAAHADATGQTNPFAGKTVLMLNSYTEGYGAQDRIVAGFMEGVIRAGGNAQDLHIEKLDLLRFTTAAYRQQLLALLRQKYANRKIDLIIITQQPALDFVRNEGAALFGNVPVIAGLIHRQGSAPALHRNEVRLPYEVDFSGTLRHALDLLPKTRHVVVVGGAHPTDRLFVDQARRAFAPWQGQLALEWLTDGDLPAMLARIATLPPDSIVVVGTFYRDKAGNNYATRDVLLMMGKQANAPLFSHWDSQLDSNVVVGGVMVSIENMGQQTAQAAADFLAGRKSLDALRDLPPSPGVPTFNWALIERWKGRHAALPEGTQFVQRPGTLWSNHRETLIGVALLIAFLAASVVALLALLTQRRHIENNLRAVADASPLGIVLHTPDRDADYVSVRFTEMFGYDANDFPTREQWWPLAYPDASYRAKVQAEWQKRWEAATQDHSLAMSMQSQVTCKDGSLKIIGWREVVLGRLTIIFAHDLTERMQAQQALESYREQLEELVEERTGELALALERPMPRRLWRDEFISNMSHELRTPLNAILGMTHLALHSHPNRAVENYLTKISNSGSFLLELVNEVLDFSKIEAGAVKLSPRAFSLDDVLQRVADMAGSRALAKELDFRITRSGALAGHWVGDPLRLEQVLVNLCMNAIKFTESGHVVLAMETDTSHKEEVWIQFRVSDTGIGIAPEYLSRIFEPFWQVETATTLRAEGTGLGLTICRYLVQLMGGDITVHSAIGHGSTFSFQLAFAPAATTLQAPQPSFHPDLLKRQFPGRRVLVVEDNAYNREFMRDFLRTLDIQVTLASSGKDGVQQALAEPFDLILMDIQMPGMDGLEASRQIRAAHGDAPPILAMTAHASDAAREQSLAAGMNDHLTKPIDPERFVHALSLWLHGGDGTAAPGPALAVRDVHAPQGAPDQVLAHVLHDLRSPLTSILGYAQLLCAEKGEVGHMAAIIHASASHMLGLTNGLQVQATTAARAEPLAWDWLPDAGQLETLKQLIDMGAVTEIREWAQSTRGGEAPPLIEQIQALAQRADLPGLKALYRQIIQRESESATATAD